MPSPEVSPQHQAKEPQPLEKPKADSPPKRDSPQLIARKQSNQSYSVTRNASADTNTDIKHVTHQNFTPPKHQRKSPTFVNTNNQRSHFNTTYNANQNNSAYKNSSFNSYPYQNGMDNTRNASINSNVYFTNSDADYYYYNNNLMYGERSSPTHNYKTVSYRPYHNDHYSNYQNNQSYWNSNMNLGWA